MKAFKYFLKVFKNDFENPKSFLNFKFESFICEQKGYVCNVFLFFFFGFNTTCTSNLKKFQMKENRTSQNFASN